MKKINNFWNWFQDNNQSIKNLIHETPINQKHLLFWIKKNLSYYCNDIDFMIVYPKNRTEKTELILTANGNPNLYEQVVNAVDQAPQLNNWKFTAFIQPTEKIDEIMQRLDEPYIIQEITLKSSQSTFLPLQHQKVSHSVELLIFLKNYTWYCDTKTLQQAIFSIIQDQAVEKLGCHNCSLVQLAQAPENKEGLIHLYDFQWFLDNSNNTKRDNY